MGFRGRGVKLTPFSVSWFSSTPAEIGLNWFVYDPSWMLHLSEFVWKLRSSVLVVFNNFLLIDVKDRSKIRSDQKRFFIALNLTRWLVKFWKQILNTDASSLKYIVNIKYNKDHIGNKNKIFLQFSPFFPSFFYFSFPYFHFFILF